MSGAEKRSEWGDMVLPGVYMIAGKAHVNRGDARRGANRTPDYAEVYRKIEEIAGYIDKLEASQVYIRRQLESAGRACEPGPDENDCDQSMGALCLGSVPVDPHFDGGGYAQFLREVMKENDMAIEQKQGELRRLRDLVEMHACTCVAHGRVAQSNTSDDAAENAARNESHGRVRFAL